MRHFRLGSWQRAPGITNSSPSQQTATQAAAGEPVSRMPAHCTSTHQTLPWCTETGWKTWTEMWSPLWTFCFAFQFLCKTCATLFTVSSFKVAVTIWLRNSKHTKNGIFCVKMSHWNSDTSFSQSVQRCEANRAQTLLGKKSPNKCCVYVTIYLFRATSIRYSWLDLKITACENANNNLCNFKWVFCKMFWCIFLERSPAHLDVKSVI